MGEFIGFLWFDVFRIRRKLVVDSIQRCFPDWDTKKVFTTGRQSLKSMGISIIEFIDLAFMKKEELLERVTIEGEENLQAALAPGKGALLLGAHMSNGDVGIAGMSARGYPMYLISKRFSSQWLDELWFRIRGRFGTQFISPRNSSYDILKALRNKGAVIFVLDQFMGPPLGVRTTFFGRPTGTAVGLALFAERAKAPVIPCFARREKSGRYVVSFGKAIPFEDQGDKNTTLQYMTQKYTDKIEEMVRAYPEQWMWLHRRWKAFNE
jgi:Kdo2-lipid IVA lauroyltransferase/acyltransferase